MLKKSEQHELKSFSKQQQSILTLLPNRLIQELILSHLDNANLKNFTLTCKKYNFFTQTSRIYRERKEQYHNDQEVIKFIKKGNFSANKFLRLFINDIKLFKEKAILVYMYLKSKNSNEKLLDNIFLGVENGASHKIALLKLKNTLGQLNFRVSHNKVKHWSLVYEFTSYAREMKKLLMPCKLREENRRELFKTSGEIRNERANQIWWKAILPLVLLFSLVVVVDQFNNKTRFLPLSFCLLVLLLKSLTPHTQKWFTKPSSKDLIKLEQSNNELYEFIIDKFHDLLLDSDMIYENEPQESFSII